MWACIAMTTSSLVDLSFGRSLGKCGIASEGPVMNIKYNKIQHFLSAPDHSVRHVIEESCLCTDAG